jgi:hypothetical protein
MSLRKETLLEKAPMLVLASLATSVQILALAMLITLAVQSRPSPQFASRSDSIATVAVRPAPAAQRLL